MTCNSPISPANPAPLIARNSLNKLAIPDLLLVKVFQKIIQDGKTELNPNFLNLAVATKHHIKIAHYAIDDLIQQHGINKEAIRLLNKLNKIL